MARQQAARARSKFSAAICSEGSAAAYDAWLLPAWRHAVSMCVRVDTSIIILVYICYYVTQSDIVDPDIDLLVHQSMIQSRC